MEQTIATLAFSALMGIPFWVGYRVGFANGLATWRKDFRRMTPDDIAEHKRIVEQIRCELAVRPQPNEEPS
jgi:hypothetical protein